MSIIARIATAIPSHRHSQSTLGLFMCDLLGYSAQEKKKMELMYAKSGIESRYSVVPDYSCPVEERKFFPKTSNLEPFPTLEYRMRYFQEEAVLLSKQAIQRCIENTISLQQITHLITVSCTGLSAPGLDIELVQRLKMSETTERTSVNFMGCYAAIHALKQADYICRADENAVVLIVCVELCTLHFQKKDDMDNITANLLFGDGAAGVLVVSDQYARKNKWNGLQLRRFHSQLALTGKKDMAWQLSSTGFLMTLSSYIPQLVEKGILELFHEATHHLGISKADVSHWAIHPGGRKILEAVEKELKLDKTALAASYEVLKKFGNMSSPTILFVLDELWRKKMDATKPEITFAAAFGPGLTMESMVLVNV